MEDLRSAQVEETQTLKLVNPERYLRAPTTDRLQKNSVPQASINLNGLKQEMQNWHVNTELVKSSMFIRITCRSCLCVEFEFDLSTSHCQRPHSWWCTDAWHNRSNLIT
jgi:hypothetical protein